MKKYSLTIFAMIIACLPVMGFAQESSHGISDYTSHWAAILALIIFGLSYSLVIMEEQIHMKKSKPVLISAGVIWLIVALIYNSHGDTHTPEILVRHNILEYAELFLFLLAAMTFINTMHERGIFDWLRAWLLQREFDLRGIFLGDWSSVILFVTNCR